MITPVRALSHRSTEMPRDSHIVPRRVAILGFDGVAALDFISPLEAFRAAHSYDNYYHSQPCYDVVTVGVKAKTFISDSGMMFHADETLNCISGFDTVLIPGGVGSRSAELQHCIGTWLRVNEKGVRRIAAVSSGIFALAASGIADGMEVATHWRCSDDVACRFPKLRVNNTASFVQDGRIYSCAGGRAAVEMALALINEDYGSQVASEVAREFVVRLKPSGAESTVLYAPKNQWRATERLADLPSWILAHLDDNLSVEILAEKAALCPRHFSRVFKQVFEATPAEFVERLRLGEARRRLSHSGVTIQTVAEEVGFRSADAFRRAFERDSGISPSAFRAVAQQFTETERSAAKRDRARLQRVQSNAPTAPRPCRTVLRNVA